MVGRIIADPHAKYGVVDLRRKTGEEATAERITTTVSRSNSNTRTKRIFDVLGSLLFLAPGIPLMMVLGAAVKLTSRGPVLYRSQRLGLHGRSFFALKLRTMRHDAPMRVGTILATDPDAAREWDETRKLSEDPRVTRLGRILRRTSLDELPQLFNILTGDMSLVGPRPKLLCEREAYGDALEEVLSVRPGLTGLWQVSGRSKTTYQRRIELDLTYVRDPSLAQDLRILVTTAAHLANPRDEAL